MKNYSNYSVYSLAGLLAGSMLLNTTGLVRGAIAQPEAGRITPMVITQNQPIQPIQPIQPKTAQQVAAIAEPITVQINSSLGDGSGVIIAHQGNVYTVLTVNHVVSDNTVKYSVRTSDGNNHPVTQVISLQTKEDKPDLAVVKFTSQEAYPVSILGNS
ncbi:MAG: trypsin-like peptidase domain-containing protein, partial [Microcoleaceae cyanobacterium]